MRFFLQQEYYWVLIDAIGPKFEPIKAVQYNFTFWEVLVSKNIVCFNSLVKQAV